MTPTPSPFYCPQGYVRPLAGMPGQRGAGNGVGTAATFYTPVGVAVDSTSNAYIADSGNNLIRAMKSATGAVTTLAGGAGGTMSGSTNGVGTFATFSFPAYITLDTTGTVLFVSDFYTSLIRAIAVNTAVVTTIAGNSNKTAVFGATNGVGTSASFVSLFGVATDASGNLFVADGYTIRKIVLATSAVSTLAGGGANGRTMGHADGAGTAAMFQNPYGVASDSAGNVYVADVYNNAIRAIVVASGIVTTLAGGGASGNASGYADGSSSTALFHVPLGVAVDAIGATVYVADYLGARIRTVSIATGAVGTLAGNGFNGYADGPGTSAMLNQPAGVAVGGSAGLVYVSDTTANLVRVVCPLTPPSQSASSSPSVSSSPTPSPSATAAGLLFRSLPRTDLLGTLVGASLSSTASEAACRSSCLASPGCDAYAFSSGALALMAANLGGQPGVTAPCFLLTNVTALVPNNMMASGVLSARYS